MLFDKIPRKWLTLVTSILLTMSLFAPAVAVAKASDVGGHWAENEITAWIDQGFLHGFDDGSIKPDQEISRAEFMAFVNRSFGFTTKANIDFADIPGDSDAWYVKEVAIAVGEGYIQGYDDGTIRPNSFITRQEAAVIVARILDLQLSADDELLKQFIDAGSFNDWSKGSIGAVVESGYMQGNIDKSFQPFKNITRAEAVVTLDRVIHDQFVIYGKSETYGPETGVETVDGNVMISVAGVTLQNMIITGDLLLGIGIGEGDVYLNGVTVKGKTTVQGGGENSIHVINSELFTVVVDKQNGSVRIVATGSTSIDDVTLQSGAKLESTDVSGDGFKNVSVQVTDSGQVILSGDFQNVQIDVPNVSVSLASGSIQQLSVNENAQNTAIQINEGAKVSELKLDAKADVAGQGTITKAVINTEGSTIEQKPEEIQVAEGVNANVGGESVSESSTPPPAPPSTPSTPSTPPPSSGAGSGGGGGGGNGGSTPPPSTVITINPSAGDATVVQGDDLTESSITLSSNYNATGLNTYISLLNEHGPVNYGEVFESFILSTKVGDAKVDGPYNMVDYYGGSSSFQYGPSSGFDITSGINQVTTTTGKVKDNAPVGTYTIKTEVKDGGSVVASATYTLRIEVNYIEDSETTISAYYRASNGGTDKGGVQVTIDFGKDRGFKVNDLTILDVYLYNGDDMLVTNTLAFDRIDADTKEATRISSPFNFGSEGNNQWAWDRGAYPVGDVVTNSDVPTKVIVRYVKGGLAYTVTHNVSITLPEPISTEIEESDIVGDSDVFGETNEE